ncbi:Glycosyltransferase involved in cell wall bisynthesis [Haloarcula vallismortis]|uniref:Glycosyl transferase group 1 n=2 Tax=Haloarcula vallismortis TaxID=28442 RepID=M0JF16_HALVA|nr:glycosyltransferase family 4 protein [Haloarcula vallismortis]EMA06589.1 glycosyl transferase group 1 [Haloarcula vallismortis ATCC 29715]SDW60569.1 Glycosyltransferase involved in cell wall bisynthesis [Haloarcula vallismortis]
MRILRVAQKLYPEVPGGGTYHVHAMSRDQAAMGHDVTVATIRRDPSAPAVEERDGYTVRRFDSIASPLGNEISPGLAGYLRRSSEFDVVHAHSHLYFSTNLAALGRWVGETPLAITNHGLYSQTAPEWVFDLYLRTLGRWTFNKADVVFCYTDEDRERVREFGVKTPIEVVHNGIDTSRFHPEGPRSDRIDYDGPVVLFVGRLVDGKRPENAVEAVSPLAEQRNAKLYVAGEGPLQSAIAAEHVEFLGQIPYEEMPAVYRAADVLVLPSRSEGLPRTVLEAMASGIGVVVSDLEQVAPVVGDGGVTVPVGDIAGFAEGLETVLDGEIADPRSRIEGQFDWAETVERATAVLEEL